MIASTFADTGTIAETAELMRLLGDPTRLRVLGLLRPGEMNVTALCGELDLAQPTVSHHLGLLRAARLVVTRRDGKQVYYALNSEFLTNGMEGNDCLRLSYGHITLSFGCNGQAVPSLEPRSSALN